MSVRPGRALCASRPHRSSTGGGDHGSSAGQCILTELLGHLSGHDLGVLEEGLNDLVLGDGLNHLATHEDLALAVARGAAQVCRHSP